MFPNPTHHRQPIHPCIQNELQSKVIYTTIYDIIFNGGLSKVCHEFYVILDFIFWIGLFVLKMMMMRKEEKIKLREGVKDGCAIIISWG